MIIFYDFLLIDKTYSVRQHFNDSPFSMTHASRDKNRFNQKFIKSRDYFLK